MVPGNARRGQPQGKRHREKSAGPKGGNPWRLVMVKRWGKSPPRTWQQGRYGKPHPEQCRIGVLSRKGPDGQRKLPETSAGELRPRDPGWQLDRRGDTVGRGMVIQGSDPRTESGLQALRAKH